MCRSSERQGRSFGSSAMPAGPRFPPPTLEQAFDRIAWSLVRDRDRGAAVGRVGEQKQSRTASWTRDSMKPRRPHKLGPILCQ